MPAGSVPLFNSNLRLMGAPKIIRTDFLRSTMDKILTAIGDDTQVIEKKMAQPEDRAPRVIWPAGVAWHSGSHTTKWSGAFFIRLPAQREHEVVFRALDGLSITIGGDHTVVRVTNDFGADFAHPMREIADQATGYSSS